MIYLYKKYKLNNQRGFTFIFAMIIMAALFVFGAAYVKRTTSARFVTVKEVDRIKARNLAEAALEKVLIVLKREYQNGHYKSESFGKIIPLEYSSLYSSLYHENFKGKLGEGEYSVKSVRVHRYQPSGRTYQSFYDKRIFINSKDMGNYELYRIEAEGYIPKSKTRYNLISYVKMSRFDVIH